MNVESLLLRVEHTNESSEKPVHASSTLYEHTQVWLHQFPNSWVINHHRRRKPLNVENIETQNLKIVFLFWVCRDFPELTEAQKSLEKKFCVVYGVHVEFENLTIPIFTLVCTVFSSCSCPKRVVNLQPPGQSESFSLCWVRTFICTPRSKYSWR